MSSCWATGGGILVGRVPPQDDLHQRPAIVLLQPEMEKPHDRVILQLGRSFFDAKAP
jgi:hypothetical protein